MRLAFVSVQNPEDPETWSGTPYFVLKALREKGIEVEAIAPLDQKIQYLLAFYKIAARLRNRYVQLDRHPIVLKSFARQIERRIKGGRFDAIFSMSSIPISGLRPGLPVVFWTDAVIECMQGYYAGSIGNLSARELRIAHRQEQASLSRASYAIYSSDWAAKIACANYRISDKNVRVVHFGANLPVNHARNDVRTLIESRERKDCVLLFIGVEWTRKGGAIAMETTRILCERGFRASLKVVGCAAPDAPYVENLGFISKRTIEGQRRISELFKEATFFLLPTRAEASAIVYCEASSFGLPIITTATGGVESYVKNGVSGHCLPLSASGEAYADRIQSVLSDGAEYRRLSWASYDTFAKDLNWNSAIAKIANAIDQAIDPSE